MQGSSAWYTARTVRKHGSWVIVTSVLTTLIIAWHAYSFFSEYGTIPPPRFYAKYIPNKRLSLLGSGHAFSHAAKGRYFIALTIYRPKEDHPEDILLLSLLPGGKILRWTAFGESNIADMPRAIFTPTDGNNVLVAVRCQPTFSCQLIFFKIHPDDGSILARRLLKVKKALYFHLSQMNGYIYALRSQSRTQFLLWKYRPWYGTDWAYVYSAQKHIPSVLRLAKHTGKHAGIWAFGQTPGHSEQYDALDELIGIQFTETGRIKVTKWWDLGVEQLLPGVTTIYGNTYITGKTRVHFDGRTYDFIAKISPDGEMVWIKLLITHLVMDLTATSDDGLLIVAKRSSGVPEIRSFILIRLDDSGTIRWIRRYRIDNDLYRFLSLENPDGGFTILAYTNDKFFVLRTDAEGMVTPDCREMVRAPRIALIPLRRPSARPLKVWRDYRARIDTRVSPRRVRPNSWSVDIQMEYLCSNVVPSNRDGL